MNAAERLAQYADYKGYKIGKAEAVFGLTTGYLKKQRDRKAGIGEELLRKILVNCPDISARWLLTGEGSMIKTESEQKIRFIPRAQEREEKDTPIDANESKHETRIPLLPIDRWREALEKTGKFADYAYEQYVIPELKDADFLGRMHGDSMAPRYLSGDILAFVRISISDDLWLQWGKTYAINTNQGIVIRIVMPGYDFNHVQLVSTNTAYPPFEIHKSQIRGLAHILGRISPE